MGSTPLAAARRPAAAACIAALAAFGLAACEDTGADSPATERDNGGY
ncbi:hypothetical protein [Allosalinactinospora lopnorensis]|nr:hypothetical protein [Allosalinactinospora lopnorensis]